MPKRKLPIRKVSVGHVTYDLEFVKDLKNWRGVDLMGNCDHRNLRLELDEDLHPRHVGNTLLHEILHAIWGVYRLPVKDEERYVETLATTLVSLFRQNPRLYEVITRNE